jgi:hypothetical protein
MISDKDRDKLESLRVRMADREAKHARDMRAMRALTCPIEGHWWKALEYRAAKKCESTCEFNGDENRFHIGSVVECGKCGAHARVTIEPATEVGQ